METQQVLFTLFIADAIRELGEVPSGHLYSAVMGKMTFAAYQQVISTLKEKKLVTEKAHLLTWVGPKKESLR